MLYTEKIKCKKGAFRGYTKQIIDVSCHIVYDSSTMLILNNQSE
jgi:hypothetical protein